MNKKDLEAQLLLEERSLTQSKINWRRWGKGIDFDNIKVSEERIEKLKQKLKSYGC